VIFIAMAPYFAAARFFAGAENGIGRQFPDTFGVEIRRTILDNYLKRWGFTPQRPIIYHRHLKKYPSTK
jgi:hypothetical protein